MRRNPPGEHSRRYWRIVHAILDVDHRATLRDAKAIYRTLRDWLVNTNETLSRAAVLRHARKVHSLIRQELPKLPPPPPPPPSLPTGVITVWDVTIHYENEGQIVDISFQITVANEATRAIIRAIAWRRILDLPLNRPGDAVRVLETTAFDWRADRVGSRSPLKGRVSTDWNTSSALQRLARLGVWRIEPIEE